MNSTIFALATAPGRAAVAVMRLSGPGVRQVLEELGAGPPLPRRASLRRLRGSDGAVLDEALVLWMPAPGSFTGEDCAELHLHGGSATVAAVSLRLSELGGEPAEPGAFTRRAFEAGRIDLVQAEAVADLVDADTEIQRRQALAQLGGSVSSRHEEWRGRLTAILAQLEAAVDFPDEEIPADVLEAARRSLLGLADELATAGADRSGERVRNGFRIALMGKPNVGKSSLFNTLLKRDAAIVTDIPGTTRDVIEAELIVAGRKVILADLAGLRDSTDVVEREGVRRAEAWGRGADLRLWLSSEGEAYAQSPLDLPIATKADLGRHSIAALSVSVTTGEGLEALDQEISQRVLASTSTEDAAPAVTRERHRAALVAASTYLQDAASGAASRPELMSEDVRLAVRELSRLTGRISTEDVLDQVFSSFCIGK